jgi:hypothetical protein
MRTVYAFIVALSLALLAIGQAPRSSTRTEITTGGVTGCNGQAVPIVTDVGQVTICVEQAILAEVAAGTTTFEDIALALGTACGAITATEVENIISLWTNGSVLLDGGTTTMRPALAKALQDPAFVAKLKAIHHKAK